MTVVVAFEPRSYREAIGSAIQSLRPHLNITIVDPDELGMEIVRLAPRLVLCSQPNVMGGNHGVIWVEFRPYEDPAARVYADGRYSKLEKVELDDLLAVVDSIESPERTRRF